MLMLLGLAVPLAIFGFGFGDDDDNDAVREIGTDDADELQGGEGNDFIDGEAGDDILEGLAGDDTVFGRDGEDVLEGADGDDMLCSGDGDDVVTGNRGQDLIEGQGGNDWVSGDYGWDNVRGDDGDDTVIGGRGGDIVAGGEGDDLIFGGILDGIPLNLEEMTALRDGESLEDLNGGIEMRDDSLGNTLTGGTGDDDLILGSSDLAAGNEGFDTFHVMSEQVGEEAARIENFNATEDAITVIVDDTDADADITVTDVNGDAVVSSGDNVLVRVTGAAGTITAADITLIAEDTVEQLFDPNAAAVA